ncbi:hypothetical protein TNCV_4400331 [Trichonephila clavipes]|nr:hypothetical protein TNCV_4400331 [Trichonephila clavipes]
MSVRTEATIKNLKYLIKKENWSTQRFIAPKLKMPFSTVEKQVVDKVELLGVGNSGSQKVECTVAEGQDAAYGQSLSLYF